MEVRLTITRGLVALIIPLSVFAIPLALALIVKSVRRRAKAGSLQESASALSQPSEGKQAASSAAERISVVLCAVLAGVGAVALVMNGMLRGPMPGLAFVAYLGLILAFGAPALLWRSRWRVPAEALAMIAVSVVAILSGFSIGFAFVPLLVVMIWVCVQHLRVPFSPV